MTFKNLSASAASTALFLSLLMCLSSFALGQADEPADEPDGNQDFDRGGLLAKLELHDGRTQYAVDPAPRVSPQEARRAKKITWTGELRISEEGDYRFAAEFHGRLRWKLGDRVLVDEVSTERAVRASVVTRLEAREFSIEIEFEPAKENGSLRTFWSGPKFLPEPLHETLLSFGPFHQVPEMNKATFVADFLPTWRRGKELYTSSGCAACHNVKEEPPPRSVSDLGELGRWLQPSWIAKRLGHPKREAHAKMPAFELTDAEAQAIAKASGKPTKSTATSPPLSAERLAKAEALLTSTGCLACHAWKEIGNGQSPIGGDLTHVGDKWAEDFFQKWLTDPRALNRHAQMPKPLSQTEINELSALLASTHRAEELIEAKHDEVIDIKQLAASRRCGACHALPEALKSPEPERLTVAGRFDDSCLGAATPQHPGYSFSDADAKALRAFVGSQAEKSIYRSFAVRETTPLETHGCTECHARGKNGGLKTKLMQVAAEAPERFPNLSALLPPSLESVGDKFEENILKEAIARNEKTKIQRPWVSVRMPHYSLSKEEMQSLVEQLLWEDRVPDSIVQLLNPSASSLAHDAVLKSAGARLVTTDGFSCTSCHDIGKWKASPAKPEARGTELAMCGNRLREAWFYRWLRNPARISPNMEMPSVQVAAKGVLGDDIDQQSRALWKAINEPGFTPPSSGALRVLAGDPSARQPIAYLMDVVVADGKTYVKPLVIAFPNQVNLLWDMEENRLARFWIGPAARQYTRGKSWYWQVEGQSLLGLHEPNTPELRLIVDGKTIDCIRTGQFKTELDRLSIKAERVTIFHRASYLLPDGARRELRIEQVFEMVDPRKNLRNRNGFTREFIVSGMHGKDAMRPVEKRLAKRGDGAIEDELLRTDFRYQFGIGAPPYAWMGEDAERFRTGNRYKYAYITTEPLPAAVAPKHPSITELSNSDGSMVPGFVARRLALPHEIMPTALAWRSDGALGVASLRGRVWEIRDRDGDGLEEAAAAFTDELAAPYGLAGAADGYDVLAKGGLYRASDRDRDGVAEELKLLASGWGHTDDYHDWAVGLPSDGKGGYYVAIPCQQDDRSPEAAKYHGKMLHLTPRKETLVDPQAFVIDIVSSGHRFPMGLARRSSDNELFVTDNQGNYNPFNELNHVAPGKFFGFVNQLDKKAKLPIPKLDAPSINLPHPWTRSVNGICFLESPSGKSFGPYEGHLVGCEYDTRRLVRMTLQKVGDSFQGAVYPLSREPATDGLSFLGPVSCAISPRGELYVGSMKDSGWGAGNNVGEVFQLKFAPQSLPAGIREVIALSETQLAIDFHGAIDGRAARDVSNYRIEAYTRISTPAYGGEDVSRRRETIRGIEFDEKAGRAVVTLEKLRPGFVYEIFVDKQLGGGKDFFPAEAYFTFHRAP